MYPLLSLYSSTPSARREFPGGTGRGTFDTKPTQANEQHVCVLHCLPSHRSAASGDGAAVSDGDATVFPDMGGGFLDSSGSGNQDGNNVNGKEDSDLLGNGALEKNSQSTPVGDKAGENISAKRGEGENNEKKSKGETRGSFLGDLLGGGGRGGGSNGGEGNGLQGGGTATAEGVGEGKGGRGRGGTGGAFPGQGLFSFMPPGTSISTIDKFTEVNEECFGGQGSGWVRFGALEVFSIVLIIPVVGSREDGMVY